MLPEQWACIWGIQSRYFTATCFAADLGYAAWGAADMLWRPWPVRLRRLPRGADLGAAVGCASVALSAFAWT